MEIPTLEVKDINLFAVWKWKCDELNQNCAICKNQLIKPCIDCETLIGEKICIFVQNKKCGHPFHKHCIRNAIAINKICPLCCEIWEIDGEIVEQDQ